MKKTWTYILIGLGLIVLIFVYLYFRSRGKYAKVSDLVNPVKKGTSVPPVHPKSGTQCPNWTPESFPLDFCMYGNDVRLLQRALGINDDGHFGNETWAALGSAGYLIPLSESDFNTITGASSSIIPSITPSSSTSTSNNIEAYAKYDGSVLRNLDMSQQSLTSKGQDLGFVTGVDDSDSYYQIDNLFYILKADVDLKQQ